MRLAMFWTIPICLGRSGGAVRGRFPTWPGWMMALAVDELGAHAARFRRFEKASDSVVDALRNRGQALRQAIARR